MKEPANGFKILIIDEADDSREIMVYLFRKKGYSVEAGKNIAEAVRLALTEKPDTIIININIPEINSFIIGKRLREYPETSNIPIIFLSAFKVIDEVISHLPGEIKFIQKPCNAKFLIGEVNKFTALKKSP